MSKKMSREQEKAMFAKNNKGSSYHTRDKYNDEKQRKERQLIHSVSQEILDVADMKNEVTRSDLQGISEATAQRIIKKVKEEKNI